MEMKECPHRNRGECAVTSQWSQCPCRTRWCRIHNQRNWPCFAISSLNNNNNNSNINNSNDNNKTRVPHNMLICNVRYWCKSLGNWNLHKHTRRERKVCPLGQTVQCGTVCASNDEQLTIQKFCSLTRTHRCQQTSVQRSTLGKANEGKIPT